MTPIERLLAKLPSAKRNGRGWMARCPAHDDRRPSLSIGRQMGSTGREGRKGSRWIVNAMPAPRPLYRLPDLADAPRVYITEGEKAADAARSVGLIATTSAHGSKSAGKTDWTPLAGKECVLLPDNDDAGRRYADEVSRILATLTPTSMVKIVELPDLPPGGDMADFAAARGADQ